MKDKTKNLEESYVVVLKKKQFDAIKDGVTHLAEQPLRRMAAHWLGSQDAMILPLDELLPALQAALQDDEKLEQVLGGIPKRSYDLLFYILSEGGVATREELATGFLLRHGEALEQTAEPLLQYGLLWEVRSAADDPDSAKFHLLNACASYLHLPEFLEGKLGAILPRRSKEQLHALVERLGGDPVELHKTHALFHWLKAQLRNPVRLRKFFEKCEINTRKFLKILALHQEGIPASQLAYEFSLFVNKDPEALLAPIQDALVEKLGLVDTAQTAEDRKSKELLYRLPREVAHIIRYNFKQKYQDLFEPVPQYKSEDEDFALASRSKERSALWIDFQQLLNHLVRCEVGVIRKGGMHKKNLKRILDRLEGRPVDAYHYLDFLFLYAYEREILYPDNERWKINIEKLTPIQTEAAFCRDFWVFYRKNASWNDRDSSPLQGVLQKGDSPSIYALRRAILRMLWDCPVYQWIEMRAFFHILMDREEAFRSGELPLPTPDVVKEKYRFMKSTLERSLSWIGIVETASHPAQRVDLFRLTEIGAWLLQTRNAKPPFVEREAAPRTGTFPEKLVIHSNLEITVPAGFPLEKQLYLARFTDDHKGRILITRAAIRRGLEDGLSAREMRQFLWEHNQGSIPGNLDHMIAEVVEKTGNIFVGGEPVSLEVSDHMLLDELLMQKRFLPFIQERAGARRAFLRSGTDLNKLMEELRSAGYSPRYQH